MRSRARWKHRLFWNAAPAQASSKSHDPAARKLSPGLRTANALSAESTPERAAAVWSARSDGSDAVRRRKPRAEEPNLTVRLPEYLQQAVRIRAVSERTTVRLVILRALRGAGFEIDDSDMTDDRGIVAKMRTRERAG